MILQALTRYYERLAVEGAVAPEGFQAVGIPFILTIDSSGQFVSLTDTRTPSGKTFIPRQFVVPAEKGRSGSNAWKTANLLWDHYGYVLAWPKAPDAKSKEMANRQHQSFMAAVAKVCAACPEDEEIAAVHSFLARGESASVVADPLWGECSKIPGCNLAFQVVGRPQLVCQNEAVRKYVIANLQTEDADDEDGEPGGVMEGVCLITGKRGPVARLQRRTPIPGTKSNAKIVCFQRNMGFDSYGKEQSFNAPISTGAAFAYATALNRMLARESHQKLLLADSTVVFWAERTSAIESIFFDIFGASAKSGDANEVSVQTLKQLVALYRSPVTGIPPEDDPSTKFFVLGLAPNAARIAIRFWYAGTVRDVVENMDEHFRDIGVVRPASQPEHLSLFRLLVGTAQQGKAENIPPNLAGEFMKAILAGTPYPRTLLQSAVTRCRAEREVTYPRAALIKAVLARYSRFHNSPEKEVGMALDLSNTNVGYRLGRLFAVLEKVQEEASPGINATIRDRFYGSASSTPVAAYPHLMKLKNHHLAKLENRGRAVNLERIVGEIMDGIREFPAHLRLEDQGRFAVGYYHQRQDFFKKADNPKSE